MPENKIMHIRIDVYKPTGKWYTGHDVTAPEIPLYKPEFNKFIRDNLPAQYGGGFVVVTDRDGSFGFHNHLFQMSDLMGV